MKTFLKNLITFALSSLFVVTTTHVDHNISKTPKEYGLCDISCKYEKHHLVNHQCQKCLNNNQKLHSIKEIDNSISKRKIRYRIVKNIIDVKCIKTHWSKNV